MNFEYTNIQCYFNDKALVKNIKDCIFAPASPTRPAPADSQDGNIARVRG
jgi:hypothetical protein